MNMRKALLASLLSAGLVCAATSAMAQYPGMAPGPYGAMPGPSMGYPPAMGGPMMGPMPGAMPGPMPAAYYQGMGQPAAPPGMMPPPGMEAAPMPGQMMAPAYGYGPPPAYGQPMEYGPPTGEFAQGGDGGYCPPGETAEQAWQRRLLWLRWLLPYDDGGCCAPHWFDVHAEFLNLTRESVGETVNLMSDTPLGPIVLSTDDLDFRDEMGFRTTLTMQVGVGSNLELTYLGMFNWASAASVSSPTNSLFSAFSNFGTFPIAGQGFTETDQASFASIAYSSGFDNLELNFRQRWQCYGCKLQGSTLFGVRYFELNEDFQFNTVSDLNNASMQYLVGTSNELVGVQVGGDMWACLIPGLTIGTEGKIGVYANESKQVTNLNATTLLFPLNERAEDMDFAFLAEAGLMGNWRINQSWTIRGGYQFLYVAGVALATENFNSTPPFLVPAFQNPPRSPLLRNDGDIFYHGLTIGFEYMW